MAFNLKQNDTSPALQTTLLDGDGLPVSINGNNGVRFHMRAPAGAVKIDADAIVVDASAGIVRYNWLPEDTDTAGTFQAEFEVTYTDNSVETFPNLGYIDIVITDDIA